MALPARVKSLDDVDEAFRGEYAEKGGEFVLQVDGIKEHPAVTGLANAHDRLKERHAELAEKIKTFGDRTPDDIAELETELEELRASKGSDLISPEDLKELRDRVKELAKKAKRADDLEGEIQFRDKDQQTRLKSDVRAALASAGVRKEALNAASALLLQEYSARYERTDEGFKPVVTGEVSGVPGDHALEEFVGDFVKGEGAIFLPPSGKGGSGADPNARGGDNGRGAKQVQVKDGVVRVNPQEVLDGKVQVVQSA